MQLTKSVESSFPDGCDCDTTWLVVPQQEEFCNRSKSSVGEMNQPLLMAANSH